MRRSAVCEPNSDRSPAFCAEIARQSRPQNSVSRTTRWRGRSRGSAFRRRARRRRALPRGGDRAPASRRPWQSAQAEFAFEDRQTFRVAHLARPRPLRPARSPRSAKAKLSDYGRDQCRGSPPFAAAPSRDVSSSWRSRKRRPRFRVRLELAHVLLGPRSAMG